MPEVHVGRADGPCHTACFRLLIIEAEVPTWARQTDESFSGIRAP